MYKYLQQTPITLSIAVMTLLLFLIPSASGFLEFDTTRSMASQIPQLFGCHLSHWNFEHLSWDVLMFVLIGMLCERRSRIDYAIVLLMSSTLIPFFVTVCVPTVHSYRGLSGIDTALFGFAALLLVDESLKGKNWQSAWMYGLLYVGMLGKIGYELVFGGTLFVASNTFAPVPVAHIVGGVIGSLVAGIRIFRGREDITLSRYESVCEKMS